jgi:hypothetical protein
MLDSIPPQAVEDFVAHLVALYLADRRTTMAIPTTVQIFESFSRTERKSPCIIVSVTGFDQPSTGKVDATVRLDLRTTGSGTGARIDTQTQATEAAWNAALRETMTDGAQWRTYLQTLPDSAVAASDWLPLNTPRLLSGTAGWEPESAIHWRSSTFLHHYKITGMG